MKALARNTDPTTSHIAAEQIESSGKADRQRSIALKAVKSYPGWTSAELATVCDLDRYQLARRLPEIIDLRQGSKRYCRVCDKLCVTWWVRAK